MKKSDKKTRGNEMNYETETLIMMYNDLSNQRKRQIKAQNTLSLNGYDPDQLDEIENELANVECELNERGIEL